MSSPHRQIKTLPAQLANQIAAGEVVERPASVVKELVENSIDAGATKISIDIEQGGHKRICIRDNGRGILKDELSLALSRHATSKIYALDELDEILSMGFRGEALASISSVARCKLISKPEHQDTAWQAFAEGSDMQIAVEPVAHPKGTTVDVVDLFYNTPARRRFLRAPKTEFQHIENIVKRLALAHADIAFDLTHNAKTIAKYKAGKLADRVQQVCKNSVFECFREISFDYSDIKIKGWVSQVGVGFENNDNQFMFINQRMMKDRLLMHAIRQAYEGMLPDAKYPAFVIYLQMPPNQLDVNVHPAKHEVRFHQARQVHDALYQAINDVLQHSGQIQPDDVKLDSEGKPAFTPSHDYIRPIETASGSHQNMSQNSARYPKNSGGGRHLETNATPYTVNAGQSYQALMQTSENDKLSAVGIDNYVILKDANHAYLQSVDQLAYAFLDAVMTNEKSAMTAQPLLMPVTTEQADCSQQVLNNAISMGFDIQQRRQKLALLQVPACVRHLPWTGIFATLITKIKSDPSVDFLEHLASAWCYHQQPDDNVLKYWFEKSAEKDYLWQQNATVLNASNLSKVL